MKIQKIRAMEYLDSRGNPTVMCEVWAEKGYGMAIVPSGASTGEHEAVELRDGDKSRYHGKGVQKAVNNVNKIIAPKLIGIDVCEQEKIDKIMLELDGTHNKGKLGANAILAVSLACAHCAANGKQIPLYTHVGELFTKIGGKTTSNMLPLLMMNVMNGGAHANWESTDLQEYKIVPISAKNATEAIRMGSEVFHSLKAVLKSKGYPTSVGDEGGFSPALSSNREPLDLISTAIKNAGYQLGKDFAFCLDPAASEFFNRETGKYDLKTENRLLTTTEMIDYYEKLCNEFPIFLIEDGLSENDWEGYIEFTKRLGKKVQIVGDDLFCTNMTLLSKGIKMGACNSILIKMNQIGSLTETLQCCKMAHDAGYKTYMSHRSGETEDTTVADLTVAVHAGQIKTGSLSRSDRNAKYNRFMYIENELGKNAKYAK